ncbi:hypothetical protein B9479_002587 [Cryptococcus floricola]|uniref:Uncharacterized protein n=1 Tax=Cryptococcus floricola TaxID=2591691 RepID=A0A5D3AYT5_9TREE|nr:hypothetical protein B9479_002587 [Cryptococcus floricola]
MTSSLWHSIYIHRSALPPPPHPQEQSGLLNQATQAANNLATQATTLVNQAANSDTTANVTSQAKTLGSQAVGAAGTLAGQAHAQAHALAPGIVPAPTEGVDLSHDLKPDSEADKEKLAKALEKKADASELKNKGILKGNPGDSLAGKKDELQKAMQKDVLDNGIAQRPHPEELVSKGILSPDEAPKTN